MKKRVISGIIAAVLGVVSLCPVAASANTDATKIDLNGDGQVDVLDYTILRMAINENGQIDSDGTVLAYVRGDVNGDGTLSTEDLDILKAYTGDGTVTDDMKAADANEDGVIDILDYSTIRIAINKGGQIDKSGVILDYKIGDLNSDGSVDADDLSILKELI